MNFLIPYIHSIPPDPVFDEYTYGDSGRRARKLKSKVKRGDYLFFHASKGGEKYITAYYVVEKVIDTIEASQDRTIRMKYENHHIRDCLRGTRPKPGEDDVLVFGNPVLSYVLRKPLPFDRRLAEKLSLDIDFPPHRSEAQAIVSATRAWRNLTENDIEILRSEIERIEEAHPVIKPLLSSDEVNETLERDIEEYIAQKPELIGKNLTLVDRQLPIEKGRLDLLFEDGSGDWIVVEVKLNRIGRNALSQIKGYMKELSQKVLNKNIAGVIVCAGIMPTYEEELRKQSDVQILLYGWELQVQK